MLNAISSGRSISEPVQLCTLSKEVGCTWIRNADCSNLTSITVPSFVHLVFMWKDEREDCTNTWIYIENYIRG